VCQRAINTKMIYGNNVKQFRNDESGWCLGVNGEIKAEASVISLLELTPDPGVGCVVVKRFCGVGVRRTLGLVSAWKWMCAYVFDCTKSRSS
jgi:hypothetical protein